MATTTIDGRDYSLVQYGHDDGFDLLLELAKIGMPSIYDALRASPSIEALAAAWKQSGGLNGLMASIHMLPARVQTEGGSALFSRFFVGVFALEEERGKRGKEGKELKRRLSDPKVRDDVFGLRFGLTFRVLTWVIMENFGPFFGEISSLLDELSPEPEGGSPASETSSEAG